MRVERRISVVTAAGWAEGAPAEGLSIEVVRVAGGDPSARVAALAGGAAEATGEVLCFLPNAAAPLAPGWLGWLVDALGSDAVAATPTLVHPARGWARATEHDLLVRSEGLSLALDCAGGPVAEARHAGQPVDPGRPPEEVVGAALQGFVVERAAYLAAGGLDPTESDDVAALDLCVRLRHQGGRVLHVPAAALYDHRPVPSRRALRHPIDPSTAAWRRFVERHGPAAAREARPGVEGGPRWVITTAAPSARVADRWGDWHFAEALARSLRRLGQDVAVQTHDASDALGTRSRELHLVVRGLAPVRRTPGQHHVLWVISHPNEVDLKECDEADLVLVASARFAEHLRARTSTPVEVLLQASDAERFHPTSVAAEHQHPVTVVAKTRDVTRRAVADALAAGIRPAIYGGGWRRLVDPELVVADHIDNRDLPVVYSSAGVVLNDHWDDMRDWGFVSNRIFDVLACGTPIISDAVSGIDELFHGAVPTYGTSGELGELVRGILADPEPARARAAAGRALVLAHHTFDHRARELLELVERYGLGEQGG